MTKNDPGASGAFSDLLTLMARLRDPKLGCPWDIAQDFRSIVPHTIEEAYEVAEAIETGDMPGLKGELGDLLFQVVFYAQMAAEAGLFTMGDIVAGLNAKMIDRHPHVFGSAAIANAEDQTRAWESHKAAERVRKAEETGKPPSALDGVIAALPALTRAEKLQKRAARIGFDWPSAKPVLEKIEEEIAELRAELSGGANAARLDEELGDLLFACANLARHLGTEPEGALRRAGRKFERRFRKVETRLRAEGIDPATAGLERMEEVWQKVKCKENI